MNTCLLNMIEFKKELVVRKGKLCGILSVSLTVNNKSSNLSSDILFCTAADFDLRLREYSFIKPYCRFQQEKRD